MQRSLRAELELKAEWHSSALEVAPVHVAPGLSAAVHAFERRLGRLATGIKDAVVFLPDGVDSFDADVLAAQVASTLRADLTTVRVVGTASLAARRPTPPRHVSTDQGRRYQVLADYRDMRQVLRLEASSGAFLARLGRSTRRNIEHCRKQAARLGMRFRCVLGGPAAELPAVLELARHNMPKPIRPRQIAGVHSLIARQNLPFHASLTSDDGRLVSAAGGFIDGRLANLLYQYNHDADRDLGPSLIMRSLLIEQLIADRMAEIAFVGGCSGILVHACDRVRAADMVIVGTSLSGVAKHWLARKIDPNGRLARVSAASRPPELG